MQVVSICLKVLAVEVHIATTIHKIFETNSSFHGK